jgi:hypothetical protein
LSQYRRLRTGREFYHSALSALFENRVFKNGEAGRQAHD